MPYNICKSEPVFTSIKNTIIALGHLKVRHWNERLIQGKSFSINFEEAKERYDLFESLYDKLVESHKKLMITRDYETSRLILLEIYESLDPREGSCEDSWEVSWESAGEDIYNLLDVLREIIFTDD